MDIKKYTIRDQWKILNKKIPLISEDMTFTNKTFNVPDINKYYGLFYLRTGFSCKSKCIHCFMENKRIFNDLSLNDLREIINIIPQNRIVILTGGEPTDREDLVDILKYLKEKKFIVNLETNGIKLYDENYLNTILPYIDLAFIPIHSTDPNVFDKITRIPGSFEKTWQGLKNLMNTEIYHMTISVFNQFNYKTMEKTFDDIQKEFPEQLMSLTFPHPVGAANTKSVVPRYSDIREVVQNILKKHAKHTIVHYLPKCITYPYQDIVVDIGLTNRLAIDYIDNKWDVVKYTNKENSKMKSKNCHNCVFYNDCAGVWKEYADLYPDIEKDLIPIMA